MPPPYPRPPQRRFRPWAGNDPDAGSRRSEKSAIEAVKRVHEVTAADRSELAAGEEAGQGGIGEELADHLGVVVGGAEQPAAPAVAGEQQGAVGALERQQLAEVLVGRFGVADVELHGRPTSTSSPTAMAPLVWSAPSTLRTRKSPRPKSAWCSSITTTQVQALVDQADIPFGHAVLGHLEEALEGGTAGQLVDEVALGPGDDEGTADRAAALGHHGRKPHPAADEGADRAGGMHGAVERQAVAARALGRRRHARRATAGRAGRRPAPDQLGRRAKVKGSTSRSRACGCEGNCAGHPSVRAAAGVDLGRTAGSGRPGRPSRPRG